MDILRQVRIARSVASGILGDDRARDIAQDVAVILLDWSWHRWPDEAVVRMTTDLCRVEAEYAARHVWIHDVPHDPTDPEDPVTMALAAMWGL